MDSYDIMVLGTLRKLIRMVNLWPIKPPYFNGEGEGVSNANVA